MPLGTRLLHRTGSALSLVLRPESVFRTGAYPTVPSCTPALAASARRRYLVSPADNASKEYEAAAVPVGLATTSWATPAIGLDPISSPPCPELSGSPSAQSS